jgi:hypothetical protein
LPFALNTPGLGGEKWRISAIRDNQIMLDGAVGIARRLGDLRADEQYKLYLLFLPKELGAEEHKSLAAFCQERGLTAQAEEEAQKAGTDR